jgi:hypothetical protein
MALERPAYTQPLPTEAYSYAMSQRVGGSRRCALKVSDESRPGATVGADLGGSSKYSSENLED